MKVEAIVDVMLVLAIILMVAALLAAVDVRVDLPAANAERAPRPYQPVFETIEADERLTENDREIAMGILGEEIARITGEDREQRIFLRADKLVSYAVLMQAMNDLRSAGYLRMAPVVAEGTGTP